MRVERMKKTCFNCVYYKRDFSKPQNIGYIEFCCKNEKSFEYGSPVFSDDTCDNFQEIE